MLIVSCCCHFLPCSNKIDHKFYLQVEARRFHTSIGVVINGISTPILGGKTNQSIQGCKAIRIIFFLWKKVSCLFGVTVGIGNRKTQMSSTSSTFQELVLLGRRERGWLDLDFVECWNGWCNVFTSSFPWSFQRCPCSFRKAGCSLPYCFHAMISLPIFIDNSDY